MSDLSAADILSTDGKYSARAKAATAIIVSNAADLARRISSLLAAYGSRPSITSGYRTPEANAAAGGAKKSAHLEGKAADFSDRKRKFAEWCTAHTDELVKAGLWMEDPAKTPTWVHLQSRQAGTRIFKP